MLVNNQYQFISTNQKTPVYAHKLKIYKYLRCKSFGICYFLISIISVANPLLYLRCQLTFRGLFDKIRQGFHSPEGVKSPDFFRQILNFSVAPILFRGSEACSQENFKIRILKF